MMNSRDFRKLHLFLKNSPISKGSILLIAQIIIHASAFIVGIWTAKVLSQTEYGTYRLLLTLVGYCTFVSLGIPQAVLFKLPLAVGQSNKEEMINIPSTLHTFLFLTRSVMFLIAIFLGVYAVRLNSIPLQWAWILMGIIYGIGGWSGLFETMFRSHQQFGILGMSRITYSICYLAGIAVLLPYWGINGILVATIIAYLSRLTFGFKKHGKTLRWNLDTERIWEYIKFGIPITLNSFVWLLITSSTIWVVTAYLSPEQTGIFGFAMLIATAYKVLPGIIGEMTHPRLVAYYGKVEHKNIALKQVMTQASFVWAGVNVLPAALSLLVFDGLIQYFLPKYNGAWGAMLCIVLGYYCYNIAVTAGNVVIMRGQAIVLLIINTFIFLLQLGLAIAIARHSTSLFAISVAPMVGLIVSGSSVLYVAFFDRSKPLCTLKHIWRILFSMFLGTVIITAIWGMVRLYRGWYWSTIMVLVAALFCVPQIRWGYNHLKNFWRTTA